MSNLKLCAVSIGEIFDKLSILDIKLEYISDKRRVDVEKEFNLLSLLIKEYIVENKYYYTLIKKINKDIWHLMDKIRLIDYNKNINEWSILCKKTIDYNDIRFRIKNEINYVYNSDIKEQKSYDLTKYTLYSSHATDFYKLEILIKYYSLIYDIVEICCTDEIYELLNKLYFQTNSIIINKNNNIISDNINTLYESNKLEQSDLFSFIDTI